MNLSRRLTATRRRELERARTRQRQLLTFKLTPEERAAAEREIQNLDRKLRGIDL